MADYPGEVSTAQPVPALTEWGIAVLALGLAGLAVLRARRLLT